MLLSCGSLLPGNSLAAKYTYLSVAIVSHYMEQAQRVAEQTAFFAGDISKGVHTEYLDGEFS